MSAEPELITDTVRDNLTRALLGLPAAIVRWVVRKTTGLVNWIIGGFRGFVDFFSDPRVKTFAAWRKLRREMDALSTAQLIAVLFTFTMFLILPLFLVVLVSLENFPHHFVVLFEDSNFWPWQYDEATETWISYVRLETILTGGDLLVLQGWDFGAVINSIYVAIIVTVFSVLIGVFFAFIVARYDFLGKRIIRTVLIFPMLATPFVGAIGIKYFMGRAGFINNLLYTTLHVIPFRIELQGLAAIIFIQSLSFFSLVYLNAYSSFMGIDPSLEEQAENLGATGSKLFRSVTLPLAMPGIQAGAILTFILSIEDLGTPIVYFEHQQAQKTLAYQVFASIATQSGQIDPAGPAIGMILLVFALTGFLAIRKYASLRSYEGGTKGGQWNPRTRRLSVQEWSLQRIFYVVVGIISFFSIVLDGLTLINGILLTGTLFVLAYNIYRGFKESDNPSEKLPSTVMNTHEKKGFLVRTGPIHRWKIRFSNAVFLYALLVPLLFLALIPQISIIILSFTETWSTNAILPDVWTLDNYGILWAYPDVSRSIQYTLVYGLIATAIIVTLGTSAAYIIARRDIPGKTLLDLLVTSPIALPGIVIATGYFLMYYNTAIFPPEGPWFLITMSYAVRKFPFTVRAAYAGLQSTPVVLEEASQNLGADKNQTFMKITMPLIGVSVLAGSLLSFVYSVSEVSTSLILGSVGRQQAPMTFWTREILLATGDYGGAYNAATLGVLMMAMQMTVITITNKILGARSSAMTGI